jgi:hypothetical protein
MFVSYQLSLNKQNHWRRSTDILQMRAMLLLTTHAPAVQRGVTNPVSHIQTLDQNAQCMSHRA